MFISKKEEKEEEEEDKDSSNLLEPYVLSNA